MSTPTEAAASQIVSQSSPSSPTPAFTQFQPYPIKSSSTTHVNQVHPPASPLRSARPGADGAIHPRPSSFASSTSGVHQRFIDAIGGSLTRQLSIPTASDISMRRTRQAVVGKHSREPLLPINVVKQAPADPCVPEPPVSGANTSSSKMRSSLEKIFKRGTSAESIVASSNALRIQPEFSEGEMRQPHSPSTPKDGYFPTQPLPHSPAPSPTSRHPGFVPMPPPNTAPFVPHISLKTNKPERNYVGYPSKNTFFLYGHLLTGGDSPLPFIASLTLTLGIAGTWFATTCVWWWHNESPAVAAVGAYMCLLTVASMLATVSG
jgi:hypothetical protein